MSNRLIGLSKIDGFYSDGNGNICEYFNIKKTYDNEGKLERENQVFSNKKTRNLLFKKLFKDLK
jgi:hypothetical protein